jgi:hypothetical protein
MSTLYNIKSREKRQIIVYTDSAQTASRAYPVPPHGVRRVALSSEQLAYVKENYPRLIVSTAL